MLACCYLIDSLLTYLRLLLSLDVGLARGVALFFRKSLGGVAVGVFFGLAILLVVKVFNRRFSREENVTEVAVMLGLVYAGYYCADYVLATSGILSTVVTGVLVRGYGRGLINDEKLVDDFWALLEHLLNTVIFTLGMCVFD
jgi:NhaP-type Na+/H+ or K+/H+ antiporter